MDHDDKQPSLDCNMTVERVWHDSIVLVYQFLGEYERNIVP
jgi:hypothetical protein